MPRRKGEPGCAAVGQPQLQILCVDPWPYLSTVSPLTQAGPAREGRLWKALELAGEARSSSQYIRDFLAPAPSSAEAALQGDLCPARGTAIRVPGCDPGLLTCASIIYKLIKSSMCKTLLAIGLSPKNTKPKWPCWIWRVYRVFSPLLFFHFHSLLYFWILARTEAEMPEYCKAGYPIIFVFFPTLNPQVLKEKAFL